MIGYPFCITGQMLTYMCRIDEKSGVATIAMTFAAVFAIINGYVIYIFMMFATSFTNGLQTIVSYNKGAESSLRLKQALADMLFLQYH